MRNLLSPKKVKSYAKKLDMPIVKIMTRGGTNHRLDLYLENGTVMHYWQKQNKLEKSDLKWKQ